MNRYNIPRAFVFLAALLFITSISPTSAIPLAERAEGVARVRTECPIKGNADLYGMGIRIGAYLQSFCVILAINHQHPDIASLAPVAGLYKFAIFVGLLWCTFNDPSFEAVEAFVIVLFCLSIPSIFPSDEPQQSNFQDTPKSSGVFSRLRLYVMYVIKAYLAFYPIPEGQKKGLVRWLRNYLYHIIMATLGFKPPQTTTTIHGSDEIVNRFLNFVPRPAEESPKKRGCFRAFGHTVRLYVEHILRALNMFAILCYGCWWAYSGMDFLDRHPECRRYTFFFQRVNMYAGFRTFAQVITPLMVLYGVLGVLRRLLGQRSIKYWSTAVFTVGLIGIIACVEMTIFYNQITEVDTVGSIGQIIPLTIGIGSTLRLMISIWEDKKPVEGVEKKSSVDCCGFMCFRCS